MAAHSVKNFDFLADERLVDALLVEVAVLLQDLIMHDRPGGIDLLGLPLSPACLAALEQRLGHGEIAATLSISGTSLIRETKFPGVWWTRHSDETGRVVALLIEVTEVPEILRARQADMETAHRRLLAAAGFNTRRTG